MIRVNDKWLNGLYSGVYFILDKLTSDNRVAKVKQWGLLY